MAGSKLLSLFTNTIRLFLFAFVSFVMLMISYFASIGLLSLIAGLMMLISGILLFISLFVLLFRKEWGKFFYTLLIIIAIVINIGLLVN
jgi:hypothetical protein